MNKIKQCITLILTCILLSSSSFILAHDLTSAQSPAITNSKKDLIPFQSSTGYETCLKEKKFIATQEEYDALRRNFVYAMPNTQNIATTSETASSATSYSSTNLQEEGVDESDTFKNDSRYLYILVNSQKIIIIDTQDHLKIVGKIENYYLNSESMYLDGNQMIVIGSDRNTDTRTVPYTSSNGQVIDTITRDYTIIRIYDLTDKSNPKLSRELALEGTQKETRKISSQFYVVTSKHLYSLYVNEYSQDDVYPAYKDSLYGSQTTLLDYNTLYDVPWNHGDDFYNHTLTTFYHIDLSQKRSIEARGFLTSIAYTYMSDQNIYFASECCENALNMPANYTPIHTYISCFNLAADKITYKGTAKCKGTLYNQFAMDATEETFRVATTFYDENWHTQNNIYTFDMQMTPPWSVRKFSH